MTFSRYTLIAAPTVEPITTSDALSFLRADNADDSAYVAAIISVAREMVDTHTNRSGMRATWRMTCGSWDEAFEGRRFGTRVVRILRTPLASVDHVKIYEPGATTQTTLDAATYVIADGKPGGLWFRDEPPATDDRPDAIQIQFKAGVETAAALPASYVHAVRLLVQHLYDQRAPITMSTVNELPFGLQHLLNQLRAGGVVA
jgi:uncharacterized phiE125 gp8 family phage protein